MARNGSRGTAKGPQALPACRAKPGTPGPVGPVGPGGAVAGYFASGVTPTDFTEKEAAIGQKTLPAGHYLLSAKIMVTAEGKSVGLIGLRCELLDAGNQLDESYVDLPLFEYEPTTFFLAVPVGSLGVLNTTTTTSLSITCANFYNTAKVPVKARTWALSALQTSANS